MPWLLASPACASFFCSDLAAFIGPFLTWQIKFIIFAESISMSYMPPEAVLLRKRCRRWKPYLRKRRGRVRLPGFGEKLAYESNSRPSKGRRGAMVV